MGRQAPSRMSSSFAAGAGEVGVGARGRAESDRGLHLLEVIDERCGALCSSCPAVRSSVINVGASETSAYRSRTSTS